jgi:hypothetical protein
LKLLDDHDRTAQFFHLVHTPNKPKIAFDFLSNDSHTASQLKASFSQTLSSIRQYFKHGHNRDVTDNDFQQLGLEEDFFRDHRFTLSYTDAPRRMPQRWSEDPFVLHFSSHGKPLPPAEYLELLDIRLDLSSITVLHLQICAPLSPGSPAPPFLRRVWKILFSLPKLQTIVIAGSSLALPTFIDTWNVGSTPAVNGP